MTHKHLQSPEVVKEITASFRLGTMNIDDLASHYGASKSKIRTILAEAGLVTHRAHKTQEEKAILEYLKMHNITAVDQLQQRLLTIANAKSFYSELSLESRVKWLNDSIQRGKIHANHDSIQHSEYHAGSFACN